MSGSINKVILIGNVGSDPEIRRLTDGRPIANLRIATSETWRDRNSGERREKTEWHTVVVMNEGIAKVVEQYVKKGAKVYVEGQIQTRKWKDQSGNDRHSTEIVLQGFGATLTMLDGGEKRETMTAHNGEVYDRADVMAHVRESRREERDSYGNKQPANFSTALDDDIPFAPEWR